MGNVDTDFNTSLTAITRDSYLMNNLQNNIINDVAALKQLKQKSKVEAIVQGQYLQVPLMVGLNNGATSYSGYDPINNGPSAGLIDATVRWAHYTAPVTIARTEKKYNSGDSRIVDLVSARLMQAEESLKKLINEHIYLDGTGNQNKDLIGLLSMIPTTASAGTYLGIIGGTVTAWAHKYATVSVASGVLIGLRDIYYKLTDGGDKPDLILTDDVGLTVYEAALLASSSAVTIAYASAAKGDGGYGELFYKGIPMVLDNYAPSVSSTLPIYQVLNTKYLGFTFDDGEITPFQQPANMNASTALINIDCQLFTNNRRRQGKLVTS